MGQALNSYAYAPSGKLTAVTRQLGSTNVTVSYDYDQQFNTLSIKDELNRPVECYILDALDRPTTVTNVENQTMSINYLVGNFVDFITRFDTTVVSNEYTDDGYLKAVYYPDETNRYTYLRNGLVQTLENSIGIISNGWNSASWLMQTVSAAASVTSAVNYTYDRVGNVTNSVFSIDNPQSQIVNFYTYDTAERLEKIICEEAQNTQTFDYTYNAYNGLVATCINTNTGLQVSYDYDFMDRVTGITWRNGSGQTLFSFDYKYNAASMITNIVSGNSYQTVVKSYQYDDLDRLISESTRCGSVTSATDYAYDLAGNRLAKTNGSTTVTYELGNGNRQTGWLAVSTNGFADLRTIHVAGSSSESIGTDDRWGQLWVSNTVAVTPVVSGTNFWADILPGGSGT